MQRMVNVLERANLQGARICGRKTQGKGPPSRGDPFISGRIVYQLIYQRCVPYQVSMSFFT